MGKHSNIILYDAEKSVIIGCAHNIGSEKNRYRELKGGLPYIYPPKQSLSLSKELQIQFKNLSFEKTQEYLNSETFRPAVLETRYTLFKELLPNSIPQNSVNEMIDSYYSFFQNKMILDSHKNRLLEISKTNLKKINNSINKIEDLLKKRDNTTKYKLYGELLLSNMFQKDDYQTSIEVFNYTTGTNISIELDETKSLKENAQKYFKLYTKSKATKEKSLEMLANLKIEKEYFENIIYSIEKASNIYELEDIKTELGLSEPKEQKQKQNILKQINKVFVNNFEIYIGKNNQQNDYIISKLAKDEDFWFHTRLCAGSHVLLKVMNSEPDENTIYECCKLAREHSSAPYPSKVGVIYTKAKYLRKPPNSPLGYVTYKNEKEILI